MRPRRELSDRCVRDRLSTATSINRSPDITALGEALIVTYTSADPPLPTTSTMTSPDPESAHAKGTRTFNYSYGHSDPSRE